MSNREQIIEEYASLGGDPKSIPIDMDIEDIQYEADILRDKATKEKRPAWMDNLSQEDQIFAERLQKWGYSEDTIQDIVNVGFDQDQSHRQMNNVIREKNEAKKRHGLDHLVEPLLPTKEDILDMYSSGILEDWLNHAPDPQKPKFKPNKFFDHFANETILIHDLQGQQEKKESEMKAKIRATYDSLRNDIPKKILIDEESGEPFINPKFKDWLSASKDFKKELETKIKAYDSMQKDGMEVPDEKSTVYMTRRKLLELIEEQI